ncbi:MAG TPA: hypothetical protein PK863_01495 [Candidatus Dojkabacteria bacterium]|nr:hypothetical protein [Candidatus Dojkabacteria bacterium]HRP36839.1 hypothetical protein [Candidatus Dojkabacteria bacterium]HRP50864.1 hypothetical protein [Candidatus Dojkabacteria bacterium]
MPKKIHQSKTSVFKRYKSLILLPLGTVILLTLCVLIFGLGLDKRLFDSSLEGYIFDKNKNPIIGANVCIKDNCAITGNNGFYKIKELKLGNNKIIVTSDKHLNLIESITIDNGVNTLSVELTDATLANLTVTISDVSELQLNELKFLLDDKELIEKTSKIDEKTIELKLENKKTGLYKLTVVSSYYVDEVIDLIVEPDIENKYDIKLEPSSTFKIYIQNWLDSTSLANTQVTIGNDTELSTDDKGMLAINELSIYEEEFLIEKDGFLKQTYSLVNLHPGINPDLTIKLVPYGKITFVKETALGKQIFLSNYDGSEARQLTVDGMNTNPWIDEKNEKVYFLKNQVDKANIVHWVDFLGEETKLISTKTDQPARKLDLVNYRKDIRIFIRENESDSKIIKTNLDDNQESILYDLSNRELQDSLLSQDGNQFIFSFVSKEQSNLAEEGIYTNNIRFNRTTNLIKYNTGYEKRVSQPKAVNDDGNILALTLDGELFIHSYSGEQIERITNDNIEKSTFHFQPETNNITYIRNIEGKKELVLVDPFSKVMKILVQTDAESFDYRWLTKDIFNYVSNGELWISSVNNLESAKLVDKTVTL